MDQPGGRAFVDLHCHSSASFDSLTRPAALLRAAAQRGLTHLAITDHERLEGALEARDRAPHGLVVIVGEEIRSREGDVIGLFLERPIPRGLSALETIAAIHEQGGLAGLPHPFDRFRHSGLRGAEMGGLEAIAERIDYVETFNARVPYAGANVQAAEFAARHRLPGVAASDAHTALEVGIAYTVVDRGFSTAAELRDALAGATLVMSRASFVARAVSPAAKVVQRLRGVRRPLPAPAPERLP